MNDLKIIYPGALRFEDKYGFVHSCHCNGDLAVIKTTCSETIEEGCLARKGSCL